MSSRVVLRGAAALGAGALVAAAAAPTAPPGPTPASAAPLPPAAAASAAPRPGAAPETPATPRVEITGGRESDTEQRRRSTAARIVIGREEIDKFGDATLGEVLRRLPGVTTPGAPGRGGPPRLRGLGGGYTQLLIDGQRLPPGFSLESISPEQVERIEILRAPTAETGARAIAGTINIVTREGFRRRLNELRIGTGYENDGFTPGFSWTRNDSIDDFIYNVSLSVFRPHRLNSSTSTTRITNLDTGALEREELGASSSVERRTGVAFNTRLQWRLNGSGDALVLTPSLFHSEGRSERRFALAQTVGSTPAAYDRGEGSTDSRFTNARLNVNWRQRLASSGPRLELNANLGGWQSASDTLRKEFLAGAPARGTDDLAHSRERSLNLTAKLSGLAGGGGGGGEPGREHSLVAGTEVEAVRRDETRTQSQDGVPLLADQGDTFEADTLRLAAYAQDEWNLNPNWALHAGLRWEGITTRGDVGDAAAAEARPRNRSSVWTPLVHVLWKPDPKKRDQVRLSLTRSYRSPGTQQLIGRRSINSRFPIGAENEPTSPDAVGNPALKPELATGVDLAFERYLEGGGVLSANVFHRNISALIRNVVTRDAVAGVPRWVSRPENIGDAVTGGVELEAKYRLDQVVEGAPRVEMRHNLALYRSRVQGIPGPDNRLDQQAQLTANVGADYRLRGLPLTLGGNVNWVPGYRTQLAVDRAVTVDDKRVLDAFVLWTITSAAGLRLLASNLDPHDSGTLSEVDYRTGPADPLRRESAFSIGASHVNWQLRLELKL
jgi:iron complex outermembrane receptor protein